MAWLMGLPPSGVKRQRGGHQDHKSLMSRRNQGGSMKITILTGAGISAESGLGTFRDREGLWSQVNLEDVATPEGFARDPAKVHAFYNHRREGLLAACPNAAHEALARLGRALGRQLILVTQNIRSDER